MRQVSLLTMIVVLMKLMDEFVILSSHMTQKEGLTCGNVLRLNKVVIGKLKPLER